MNDALSTQARRLVGQPMFRLLDRVNEMERSGRSVIHFEIGDPDFATPSPVIDACIQALKNGHTHYTSSYGLYEFRQAIQRHTQAEWGFSPDINQIIVAPANALISFVIQCLVNPGEEVIIPDPSFSTYQSALNFLGISAIGVPLRESRGFRLDPAEVKAAITKKTKLIIINSPQNPTGAVMSKEDVQALTKIAQDHKLFILSDEVYRMMAYGEVPASPAIHDQCKTRTILLNSLSKSHAMTGWRLGYVIAPPLLVEKLSLLVQTVLSCISPFTQYAGIAALENSEKERVYMKDELRKRRDSIVADLNTLPGVSCLHSNGPYYAFANITGTGMTSEQLARQMLEVGGVALLPGTNFGESGEGYVRLSYATSMEHIKEGMLRMKKVLKDI